MSQNLSVCSTIKLKFKHNNVIMKGYCRVSVYGPNPKIWGTLIQ